MKDFIMQEDQNKTLVIFKDEEKAKETELHNQFKVEEVNICSKNWQNQSIQDTLKQIQEWRCL